MGYFVSIIDHHPGKHQHQDIGIKGQAFFQFGKNLDHGVDPDHGPLLDRHAGPHERGVNDHNPDQLFTPGKGVIKSIPQYNIEKQSDQRCDDNNEKGPFFKMAGSRIQFPKYLPKHKNNPRLND
jgi:hypothetical protein